MLSERHYYLNICFYKTKSLNSNILLLIWVVQMEQYQDSSEWNEQQLFSHQFFNQSALCRQAQMARDPFLWKTCLVGKISIIIGVVDKKSKEYLSELKIYLDSLQENCTKFKMGTVGHTKAMGRLYNKLFYAEAEVDTIANKKMPFLNMKKEIDIRGL